MNRTDPKKSILRAWINHRRRSPPPPTALHPLSSLVLLGGLLLVLVIQLLLGQLQPRSDADFALGLLSGWVLVFAFGLLLEFLLRRRRMALEALSLQRRQVEVEAHLLVDQVPGHFYALRPDGLMETQRTNPTFAARLGAALEEWRTDPLLWQRHLHPADRDRVLKAYAVARQFGRPFEGEFRVQTPDGAVLWLHCHESLLSAEDSPGFVLLGVVLDISLRRAAEEASRRRDAILTAIAHAAANLARSEDWQAGVGALLSRIGVAIGAETVLLGRADGQLFSGPPLEHRLVWQTLPAEGLEQLSFLLRRPWSGLSIPESPWAHLLGLSAEQDLVSAPISVAGAAWGFIGVARQHALGWSGEEAGALRVAAELLGATLARDLARAGEQAMAEARRSLIEQLPAFVYTLRAGRPIYASPQLQELLGYAPEDWLSDPPLWLRRIASEETATVAKQMQTARSDDTTFSAEYRIRHRDGRLRWVRVEERPGVGGDGQPERHGLVFDIGVQKESEAVLARRDAVLAAVTHLANLLLSARESWRAAADESLESLGRAAGVQRVTLLERRGAAPALPAGEGRLSLAHEWSSGLASRRDDPDFRDASYRSLGLDHWESLLRQGQTVVVDAAGLPKAAGARRVASAVGAIVATPVFVGAEWWGYLTFEQGHPARSWSAAEVEALKIAASILGGAIARSRAEHASVRFGRLLDEASSEIYIYDPDSLRHLMVNERARLNLGYSLGELLQMTPVDLKPEFDQNSYRALLAPLGNGQRDELIFESLQRRADGSIYPVECRIRLTKAEDPPVFISVINDISERRAFESQLRQAQKVEALGQMSAGIAHDFANFLTAIRGYSKLLGKQLRSENHPGLADVEAITEAAERASILTRQLLTFGRRSTPVSEAVDLVELVEGLLPMLRRLLDGQVRLVADLPAGMGRVRADPHQLEQVVMNLVINARDAMPSGGLIVIKGQRLEADLELPTTPPLPAGDYLRLDVSDSGSGMDLETQGQMYEPFFTTKRSGQGTGLGLATVHAIVSAAAGGLGVRSQLGLGTVISVYLPRLSASEALVSALREEGSTDKEAVEEDLRPTDKSTVLVVEDDPGAREMIGIALRRSGYTTVEAADQKAALAGLAGLAHCDLLVSDVILPGVNGPTLYAHLRQSHPELRVLYISGYPSQDLSAHGVEHGRVPYLAKPFEPEDLLRAVRAALS